MQKVATQADKVIQFNFAQSRFFYRLGSDGLFYLFDEGEVLTPNVILTLSRENLGRLMSQHSFNPEEIASFLHIEGDAGLAQLVSLLAKDLRWDIQHELSQLFGAVPAAMIRKIVKHSLETGRSVAQNFAENMSEYLSQEQDILISKVHLDIMRVQLEDLQRRVQALQDKVLV